TSTRFRSTSWSTAASRTPVWRSSSTAPARTTTPSGRRAGSNRRSLSQAPCTLGADRASPVLVGIYRPGSDPVAPKSPVAIVSELAVATDGAFRGAEAVRRGVSRDQLAHLRAQGVIERVFPDTYTLTAVPRSDAQ